MIKDSSRIVFDLPRDVKFSYFSLPDPARFVIDVPNAVYRGDLPGPASLGPHVLNMRDGVSKSKRLRLVFDLTTQVESRAFVMGGDTSTSPRLVIDLAPEGSDILTSLSQSVESFPEAIATNTSFRVAY